MFGKENDQKYIYVNFESNFENSKLFDITFDPKEIKKI